MSGIELNGEFHVRRAIQAIKQSERKQKQSTEAIQQPELKTQENNAISRVSNLLELLMKAAMGGGIGGFCVGIAYGFRSMHLSPLSVGLATGAKVALVTAQFAGFRFIVPDGMQRIYWTHFASDQERHMAALMPSSSLLHQYVGGIDFLRDLTSDDEAVLGSAVAGASAGYLMTRAQNYALALHHQLSTAHSHSVGVRGAVFWGMTFAFGHWAYLKLEHWRQRRLIDRKLRHLYAHNPQHLKQYLDPQQQQQHGGGGGDDELPDRRHVVSLSWRQLIDDPVALFHEYGWDLPNWLPLVHTQQEYEYRHYLEQKSTLLQQQVDAMEHMRKIRQKQIRELKAQLNNDAS